MAFRRGFLITTTVCALLLIPSTGNAADSIPNRTERLSTARSYLSYLQSLSDLVPVPRPAEQDWVQSESEAIHRLPDGPDSRARQASLYASVEFQHQRLYQQLAESKEAIQCIVDTGSNVRREMQCWAQAASLLSYRDIYSEGVRSLMKAGRLPTNLAKRMGRASVGGVVLFFDIYSHSILNAIIIPYLAAE